MRQLAFALLLAVAVPLAAAEPQITNLTAVANGSNVHVRFNLANGFADEELIKALQSGLPTGFDYIVEIYRDRPNWFDQGVDRSRIEVRATRNPITREYVLSYRRDRRLVSSETFTDLEALERRMSSVDEPALFDFGGRRPYKLRVRVRADFGRTFLFYIWPSSNSTRWRDVRLTTAEPKP